jgi:hypothetical protein
MLFSTPLFGGRKHDDIAAEAAALKAIKSDKGKLAMQMKAIYPASAVAPAAAPASGKDKKGAAASLSDKIVGIDTSNEAVDAVAGILTALLHAIRSSRPDETPSELEYLAKVRNVSAFNVLITIPIISRKT